MFDATQVMNKLVKLKFDTVRGSRILGSNGFSFQFVKDVSRQVDGQAIFLEILMMDITLKSSIVGRAFPQGVSVIKFHDFEQTDGRLSFILDVDRTRLESLESVRNGQDLEFDFWIHGMARINGASDAIQHHEKVTIKQTLWTEALNETGYLKYFTFETSLPPGDDSEFAEVQAYFTKAQQLYLQGHYGETLVNCRCAMEALEKKLSIENLITDARQHFCESKNFREDMTLEDRIRLLYGATKSIAHLGAHADGQAVIAERVMRKEAKLVLAMTGALLAHALGA
jgi:hypothetical protein